MIHLFLITLIEIFSLGFFYKNPEKVFLCEKVAVASDRKGFMLEKTHRTFHPWGMNYGHYGMLAKDFNDPIWDTLVSDFQKMKNLGANVVRIHLQFDQFMLSTDHVNPKALVGYKRLLDVAGKTGLYLDITGLASYRPGYRLAWYDSLDETGRWDAQAKFWEAVAQAGAGDPAIFCYDLMNEPIIAGKTGKTNGWYTGHLGEYDFCQYLTLAPRKRSKEEIGYQWINKMTHAIRKYDDHTLITVGFLPWMRSSFIDTIAPLLDFMSAHIYPHDDHITNAINLLNHFDVNKPVVIEETFPLACDTVQLATFMRKSKKIATGWMGHYLMSHSLKELKAIKNKTMSEAIYLSWLDMFVRMKPHFAPGSINCEKTYP